MSVADLLADARRDGRTTLTEAEAKDLFATVGIPVPEHAVAGDAEAAVQAAAEIGYPVVAKVASPDVLHKSEWGDGVGVQVELEDASAVRRAAESILAAGEEAGLDVEVLVEQQLATDAGTELIVGGLRKRTFGPVVLVGLGGVFTEVFDDTAHRLAPLSAEEAHEAIAELESIELLSGFRSRPPADLDALAETVTTVGDLVADHDEIAEVDVNPLLAEESGVVALDALVSLAE